MPRLCALNVLGRTTVERLNYASRIEVSKYGERCDDAHRPTESYSRPFSTYLVSLDVSLALLSTSLFSFIVASADTVLTILECWPQLGGVPPYSHFSMLRKTTTSRFAKSPGVLLLFRNRSEMQNQEQVRIKTVNSRFCYWST